MNKYEYTTKTIPKNQRILVSALILIGTLSLAGYFSSLLHQAMEEGLLSGKQNLYFFWSFPVVMLVIGLLLSLYYWKRQETRELTPEAKAKIKEQRAKIKEQQKEWEENFMKKWYARYPAS